MLADIGAGSLYPTRDQHHHVSLHDEFEVVRGDPQQVSLHSYNRTDLLRVESDDEDNQSGDVVPWDLLKNCLRPVDPALRRTTEDVDNSGIPALWRTTVEQVTDVDSHIRMHLPGEVLKS